MDVLWRDEYEDEEEEPVADAAHDTYEDEGGEAVHEVLPLEVMQHIVSMLDPTSLARAESVCRAWHSACASPFVWETVFRRHFSSRPAASVGWRERCVKAAIALRRLYSQSCTSHEQRLRDIINCGHDLVLRDLLATEGARVSLDLLNGCQPVSVDQYGNSRHTNDGRGRPVFLAANVGSAPVLDILALAGADVNVIHNAATPVGVAAAKGFLDAVEVLLRHGAGGDDFTRIIREQQSTTYTRKGVLPLFYQAATGGHTKIMEILLAKAGGPERAREMVRAADVFAAENGSVAMVELLLRQGAATLHRRESTVRLLVERGAQLIQATTRGQKCGVDINLAGAGGRTPLHSALRSVTTSLSFIRYLLSRGADAKAIDDSGFGALHHALARVPPEETLEICRCLIEAGADVHQKNPILPGFSDVDMVTDVLDLLAEHGVNVRDPEAAAKNANCKLLEVLLDRGMDPNADGGHPNVLLPLHATLTYGHWNWADKVPKAIKLLLQRGADLNRHSGPRQGPALFFVQQFRPQDFDLLMAHGADINARNAYGETLLQVIVSHEPSFHGQLSTAKEWVTTLIASVLADEWFSRQREQQNTEGADPKQCRVIFEPRTPRVHRVEWAAFLRSVGIATTPSFDEPDQDQENETESDA
ncbi:Fbox domain containing protein [Acanthamoeba castellanii str. Neff]|uniref:Fbox domain containing protein n=1 Tax=Acanthamoeba castellanii (strain ATCC 30010 / Neff) TaxID=1257118 RepID=L8HD39_ACACF|nr:Fbox domain containing protein [Acanthamoeba castellanii str. Neff]ELR22668.1 Fbox domain containing protein [Acanthamoeba castellanii str. Neff]